MISGLSATSPDLSLLGLGPSSVALRYPAEFVKSLVLGSQAERGFDANTVGLIIQFILLLIVPRMLVDAILDTLGADNFLVRLCNYMDHS